MHTVPDIFLQGSEGTNNMMLQACRVRYLVRHLLFFLGGEEDAGTVTQGYDMIWPIISLFSK